MLANTRASIFARILLNTGRASAQQSGESQPASISTGSISSIGWAGRPKNCKRAAFQRYIESPGNRGQKPEVNLLTVDLEWLARFLASANPGSTILFDDYKDREHYHVVEDFLKPNQFCGRQAIFDAQALDREALLAEYKKFQYVMD